MILHRRAPRAFTLLELLVVISIIALLASLLFPVVGRVMDNADTTKCLGNLRQIASSINLYCADNNNTLPSIETDPTNPVYPEGTKVEPIGVVLKPYGVTPAVLTCPADLKAKLNYTKNAADGKSFFEEKQTSYEWRPTFDGEQLNALKIYTPRGAFNVPMNRVRLLVDFVNAGEAPHNRGSESSSYNSLQADGSVRTLNLSKAEAKP
jgi:prepilin-type N-terminal cleavage/methylation domain-containing protein